MTQGLAPAVTVGFLREGPLSDEQSSYRTLLQGLGYDVELIELATGSLSGYDVLCWHCDERIRDDSVIRDTSVQSRLGEYIDSGGGLFLTLHAVEAVEPLDIDPVSPDRIVSQSKRRKSGILIKSLYRDHPVFDGFDDLRQLTQTESRNCPSVSYERFVPKSGDVLASSIAGSDDCPEEKSVYTWRLAKGEVIGMGSGCNTLCATDPLHRETLEQFIDNVVRHLAEQNATPLQTTKSRARDDFDGMRASLAEDPHRPIYHLSPPANWLNDPNGLIEWNDSYHVFYQYNPAGPFHGSIHWGHAVSEDLIRWEDRPIALSPDPGTVDEDGCWSGCAVDHDGTPTFLYTGGSERDQFPCLAIGDADLTNLTKYSENPIIGSVPDRPQILSTEHWAAEFRDHCVWFDDGKWFQLIGSGIRDVGGTALLYESDDLHEWNYCGPILIGDWPGAGAVWECPELLDLGTQELLHVSDYSGVVYFLGSFEDESFDPETRGKLDYGQYYAPQSLTDDGGRVITWGWVPEGRSTEAQWDAGWSGMLSIPRVLRLDSNGELHIEPASELAQLRTHHQKVDVTEHDPSSPNPLSDIQSTSCEIELQFEIDDAWEVGLAVFQSPANEPNREQTLIRYTDEDQLIVDRSCSSRSKEATATEQQMSVSPNADGTIHLRCFLDRSVIEIFINKEKCLTSRVYPTREVGGMELYTIGGRAEITRLDVWELGDVYRNHSQN